MTNDGLVKILSNTTTENVVPHLKKHFLKTAKKTAFEPTMLKFISTDSLLQTLKTFVEILEKDGKKP